LFWNHPHTHSIKAVPGDQGHIWPNALADAFLSSLNAEFRSD
jgi:hypothetical protein